MVRTINEKLDEVLKVNQSIVQELNNKTTELQLLQTENMRLRSILRQQDTKLSPSKLSLTQSLLPTNKSRLSYIQSSGRSSSLAEMSVIRPPRTQIGYRGDYP
jgi:regulator of replication initiation timing